ncbi:MAG: DUF2237 domain-containing protein [Myxococcales bacterium]|nr:DUF2237 domain-containing protein [Myxococcales bacterium]MCB9669038.1 DUF2237 domain-containing protein [Alphaproteobacteria bacterium]MCB9672991.1 DUF2237 domain-containing protein [Alphaproteobacteria bacterium]
MLASLNVLGTPLKPCSHDPLTGWFRDGCCNTDARDRGSHTVCARVTDAFLEELRAHGNDLVTPMVEHGFPGLRPGDCWCVCAASWRVAAERGVGCPVDLEATHAAALQIVPLELLMEHAWGGAEA